MLKALKDELLETIDNVSKLRKFFVVDSPYSADTNINSTLLIVSTKPSKPIVDKPINTNFSKIALIKSKVVPD